MGEVLHTMPTLADAEAHEVGPVLAGLGTNYNLVSTFFDDFNAFGVDVDDKAVKHLVLEKDVVASAENQGLLSRQGSAFNERLQVADCVDFDELFCYGIEAEAVVGL